MQKRTGPISGKYGSAGAINNSWSRIDEVPGNDALGQKLSIFYLINLPNSPSWSRWFYPILKIRKLKLKEVDLRGKWQSQDSRPGLSDHKACGLNNACIPLPFWKLLGICLSSNIFICYFQFESNWKERGVRVEDKKRGQDLRFNNRN